MDPWYRHGLMVFAKTHGIDNTHGIDLNSWYNIGTPKSHTYERVECYPYAGFLFIKVDVEKADVYYFGSISESPHIYFLIAPF